ncbi:hypothetical protein Zmor_016670 [Zophobas morio]|uniref:FAM21/CAPZIP domain-containing protein n=1 Tax=Zophobas morio TaxID=2755281 RepID=A0AA38I734_9CUCU|nr:hypothetical protein Zmor_016670 [Zophobas morio]
MSTNKPWDRPWSMDEIIENSDKWSIAGDVALLNTLKAFADNLLTRTTEINGNLQNLTNTLDQTSLQLNIAQNEFQSLRNTQFIESRVYEDDESLPQPDVENKTKVEEKNDHTEDIRLAALKGLEVLDEYFDKVEVSVSDSEDDDIDLPNYVLRPKDLYIQRPLPYVIGSADWHKNWHVGLEDSSSDSETEKVSDKFSESDSESDLPIIQDRSQIKGTSDTSSELDFSQKIEPKHKDFFNSSDSENSVQAPVSNKSFAEQLAAKLGHVVSQEFEEPEVNRRPIQNQTTNYGDIFFDEPPPLDEPKGPFSRGRGLFDDDDDDDISITKPPNESPKLSKTKGLFDEESDEDIFSKKTKPEKQPLFNEEPPALDEKKKPVGGVSIFGGGNLFDKKLLRRQQSSDDDEEAEKEHTETSSKKVNLFDDDSLGGSSKTVKTEENSRRKVNLFDSDEETNNLFNDDEKPEKPSPVKLFADNEPPKENPQVQPEKKISLFDDDDDLFKDDLFSSNTKKSFTSGLFDDIPGDDLFSSKPEEKPKLSGSLFDDVVIPDDKNSINVDNTDNTNSADPPRLFSNNLQEVTDGDKVVDETDFFKPNLKFDNKPKLSLFDSPPPEPDDLFGELPPKTDFRPNLPLFDPSPPPDDDWDTKSDNLSEPEDFTQDFETPTPKTNLFSEEPPALDFEPGLKKPGKLKHNLNINVGALMPGFVPPKRPEKKSDKEVRTSEDDVTPTSTRVAVTSPRKVAPASFDDADKVQVLQSVTKDRARVPLNRRPSTRRGRKAALEKSSSDFKLDNEQEVAKNIPKPETEDKQPNSFLEQLQSSLDAKTKPSSLFDEHIPQPKIEDKPPSDTKNSHLEVTTSLFDEVKTEDFFETSKRADSLFDTPEKVPKPVKADSSKTNIFDEEDDDDDLFSVKKPISQAKTKKSLFDDNEDDDDDIFKSFSSASVTKTESRIAKEKKVPKVSSVKKLENTQPDDDPLSALLK